MPATADVRPLLLTLAVTAGLLNVDPATVHRWVRTGRCPVEPVRVGGSIKFRAQEVASLAGVNVDELWASIEAGQ